MNPVKDSVAEAVRISHCASSGQHECVGTCKITPRGILLECPLCGDGEAGLEVTSEYMRLDRILKIISIDIRMINRESILEMMKEFGIK